MCTNKDGHGYDDTEKLVKDQNVTLNHPFHHHGYNYGSLKYAEEALKYRNMEATYSNLPKSIKKIDWTELVFSYFNFHEFLRHCLFVPFSPRLSVKF